MVRFSIEGSPKAFVDAQDLSVGDSLWPESCMSLNNAKAFLTVLGVQPQQNTTDVNGFLSGEQLSTIHSKLMRIINCPAKAEHLVRPSRVSKRDNRFVILDFGLTVKDVIKKASELLIVVAKAIKEGRAVVFGV